MFLKYAKGGVGVLPSPMEKCDDMMSRKKKKQLFSAVTQQSLLILHTTM